ncbi:hemolysin family protein [Thermomonospora cellulosilytica]|uniref:CBS domain containing-hemolysin-like protein n=1 Tax=Thermomonospora cellulosilytica TaxID=1411118 RepID=A0A7W3MTP1_9ACTN|nr:hemolysin family protein [Thermomonospora cellulosilytica]MBA9001701.1 CBS domain containing-hemolysin-like protein [Thermomonospora cellulosilytica]
MDPLTALALTVLLLIGNGFFVASEFALVAAKRPRLERAARAGSRPAASAVAGIRELSMMLAGAQLGITMCTLGLGVVTEPAFEKVLSGPLHDLGLPEGASHVVALTVALSVVTFLHMVVGEMAPKSWAISHPERSALVLAMPFRAFARVARPVLALMNGMSNGFLRLIRVTPRDALETHTDPQRLGHLLGESRRLGLIDRRDHDLLGRVIAVREAPIADLTVPVAQVTTVPATAGPLDIRRAARASGHARMLVRTDDGRILGVTHVRDAITAENGSRAADMAYPIPSLEDATSVLDAATRLRRERAQLGVVTAPDGTIRGIVTLDDLLGQLLAANPH